MAHHEPLKALGPIDWADVPQDDLKPFLSSTFSQAQTAVDSIPVPPAQQTKPAPAGRARSHTDSSVFPTLDAAQPNRPGREHANTTAADNEAAAAAAAHAAKLQKEWKEVKIPSKDNPMDISVYKLSAKDGRGAWFARRSLHSDVPFDKFKLGLAKEFGETMKNSSGPGAGSVRGIGAERRAEHFSCDGAGKAEVWLLSAQFPGPTTPRDFVTLLLTGSKEGTGKGRTPRQFMVVSKPCNHPECQPRAGFIRGSYESVELIREVPVERPFRRVRSSVDLRREDVQLPSQHLGSSGDKLDKEAILRSAVKRASTASGQDLALSMSALPRREAEDGSGLETYGTTTEMAVEWIMLTRSDPGGSVPRFMVEKGTPGGIVSDAGRFIKWLGSKSVQDLKQSDATTIQKEAAEDDEAPPPLPARTPSGLLTQQQRNSDEAPPPLPSRHARQQRNYDVAEQEQIPPSGLYSMITGVIGAASSAVTSRLPNFSYAEEDTTDPDNNTINEDDESDTESEASFASAPEPDEPTAPAPAVEKTTSRGGGAGGDKTSLHSSKSEDSTSKISASTSQHEKQLKKLQDRYRKIEEKMARQQERKQTQHHQNNQSDGDNNELTRLKAKHERELARQEDAYRKEVRKLEEKRRKEERKAEERRRKEAEKEARGNLAMALERARVERDMAFKQIDILKAQVGDLQAQNTRLVAQLGRLGGRADEIVVGNGDGAAGAETAGS